MRFSIECNLDYQVSSPTTLILNVEAQRGAGQHVVSEDFRLSPGQNNEAFEAPETGNRYRRMVLQPGNYNIGYRAEVVTEPQLRDVSRLAAVPIAELPLEVMNHLFPSRYCQSDRLARFAAREFGGMAPGHEQVTAICNWIYENVDYVAGSSDGSTSAYDTFTLRAGVCRDFAHLGITLTRALGIPARFVSAYALNLIPQDFHAVFEAYLGGRWYLFDATRLCPLDGIVRIAVGRDAADSAFSTYFGSMSAPPKTISVSRLDAAASGDWTVDAVSLSAS